MKTLGLRYARVDWQVNLQKRTPGKQRLNPVR